MVIRQQLLRPTGAGVPTGPVPVGLDGLWIRSDAYLLGVSGARLLVNPTSSGNQAFVGNPTPAWDEPLQTYEVFVSQDNASQTFKGPLFYGASSNGDPGFRLFITTSGELQMEVGNGVSRQTLIITPAVIVSNTWQHLVLVFDRANDQVRVYVDGVDLGLTQYTAGQMGGAWGSVGLWQVGGRAGGVYGIDGSIARVRAFNGYAFTPADVVTTFNFGNGVTFAELPTALRNECDGSYNGLEAIGPMIENTGLESDLAEENGPIGHSVGPRIATAVDVSGNDHTLTLDLIDPITGWSTDTPSGSYPLTKRESVAGSHAIMTAFADPQAAYSNQLPSVLAGRMSIIGEGSNSELAVRNPPTIAAGAPFSFAAWIKPDGATTRNYLFNNFRIFDWFNGTENLATYTDNWYYSPDPAPAGVWTLAGFSRNAAGNITLWTNASAFSGTGIPNPNVAEFSTLFGAAAEPDKTRAFGGNFVLPQLWDRELSQAEWDELLVGNDVPAGRIARWEFDEGQRSVPHTAGGLSIAKTAGALAANYDPGTVMSGDHTFAAWARFTDLTPNQALFGLPTQGMELYKQQTTNPLRYAYPGVTVNADLPLELNQWFHLAMRYTAASQLVELFYDGLLVGSGTVNIAPFSAPYWYISGYTNATDVLQGNQDYTGLWPTALSDQDIRNLSLGLDPIGDTPNGLWPLDDGPQGSIPSDGEIVTSVESAEGRRAIWLADDAAQRAQYFESVAELNNKSSLYFDGIDDFFEYPEKYVNSSVGTIHFVIYKTAVGSSRVYGQGNTGQSGFGSSPGDGVTVQMDDYSASSPGASLPINQAHLVTIIFDGANTKVRIDGVDQVVTPSGVAKWFDAVPALRSLIGADDDGLGGARNFVAGYVPEQLIYASVLDSDEVDRNEAYLGAKYQ